MFLNWFMITLYLNFSNYTIRTIQVCINGCKWYPCFIPTCFGYAGPSLGVCICQVSCLKLITFTLTYTALIIVGISEPFLFTACYVLIASYGSAHGVITEMSMHSSLSTLSWKQTDRTPSETVPSEGAFPERTHVHRSNLYSQLTFWW
jgi:hypothetical protein